MSNIKCKYGCKNGRIFMPKLGEFVDCPDHSTKNLDLEKVKGMNDKSLADTLLIPEEYRNLGVVDKALFLTPSISNRFSSTSINMFATMLEKINKNIYNGVVPKISCYFYCPPELDIKHFIYSSQKLALEKGLSVVPYITANRLYEVQSMGDYSLSDLEKADNYIATKGTYRYNKNKGKDLSELLKDFKGKSDVMLSLNRGDERKITLSSDILSALEGYRHLNETGLTYRDYIRADICYIYISANTKNFGYNAIADILAERSMRSLPTFVFGYWPSKGSRTGETLSFLISDEFTSRLDLLVPFDLLFKTSKGRVEFKKQLESLKETNSDVVGGYKI